MVVEPPMIPERPRMPTYTKCENCGCEAAKTGMEYKAGKGFGVYTCICCNHPTLKDAN